MSPSNEERGLSDGAFLVSLFITVGLLCYFIGLSIGGRTPAPAVPVVVSCPIGTVQIAKIDDVWTCIQEGEAG